MLAFRQRKRDPHGLEPEPYPGCAGLLLPKLRQNHQHHRSGMPFCGGGIDGVTAQEEAAATGRVNAACSDASYLKTLLTMAVVFFVVLFVPFLSLIGLAGTWFLRFALPVMCIRWWVKYGTVKTQDPDFSRARTSAVLVSIAAVIFFFTFAIHIRYRRSSHGANCNPERYAGGKAAVARRFSVSAGRSTMCQLAHPSRKQTNVDKRKSSQGA